MTASFESLCETLDLISVPCSLLDLAGNVVHVNPANERLLGRTIDELRGQTIDAILPTGLREETAQILATIREQGPLDRVVQNRLPDGTTIPVEVHSDIVHSPDGEPRWILSSVRDLTQQIGQLEQLAASALTLLSAPGEDIIARIVEVARGLIGARYAALGVVEDGRLVHFVPDGMSESEIAGIDHWPTGEGLLGAMVAGRETIRVPDMAADWRRIGFPAGHPPMRSFLRVPIQTTDETYGYLVFTDKVDGTEFNALDERTAELFAAHAAIAIRDNRTIEALKASEYSLAEAQQITHIGSWEWNVTANELRFSDEAHRIYGLEPRSFSGSNESFDAIVHPDDIELVRAADRAALEDGVPYDVTHRIVWPDGVVKTVHETGEVIRDEAGHATRLVGTTQDITEQVAAEAELSRLITAIENTADAIWMHDLDKNVTYVNPSFSRLYGYAPAEIIGQHAGIVDSGRHAPEFFNEAFAEVTAGEIWTGALVNRCKDGSLIEVEAAISPAVDGHGKLIGWVQTDRDVTLERRLEGAFLREAHERQTIESALRRIDTSASPEEIAAIACTAILELGGIDSAWVTELGPDRGLVLASAGQAAPALIPAEMLPPMRARYLLERARVGPWVEAWKVDPSLDNAYGERLAMTGLHTAAYAPIKSAEGVIGVLGFGIHDAAAIEQLNEHIPALDTFASILGALLAPGLETRHRSQEARDSIQAILDAAAFTPFFQPIVDLHDGTVVGYEALSRFSDGTRPDVVFGQAEWAGLGLELETATLAAALEASSVLPAGAYLSLNASPSLIASGPLREILAPLKRSIVLEVTEHSVVQDYEELRAAGKGLGQHVRFAVDDAGAGYASFRHILELEPAVVKLDIGLIRGIDADPARQALLAGMSYFAVKRKIKLVAEGIETKAELAALGQLGIRYGQGYLLGRPQDGRGPGPWPTNIRWSDPGAGKR